MSWIVVENGTIVSYDIRILRILSRDQQFCRDFSDTDLDQIFTLLFAEAKVTTGEKFDIVASLSNIILLNRDLHVDYFIPKYSNKMFIYCDTLIKQLAESSDVLEQEVNDWGSDLAIFKSRMKSLIPIYRILFLTLYGGLEDISNQIIEDVFNLFFDGFKTCAVGLNDCYMDQDYQLLLNEVLKCLYTLHHKFNYGVDLLQDEEFSDDCMRIANKFVLLEQDCLLLVKNTLNFLFVLFQERENAGTEEFFEGSKRVYFGFFDSMKQLLVKQLKALDTRSVLEIQSEDDGFLVNLLVVFKHLAKLLKLDYQQKRSERFKDLFNRLALGVLPETSRYTYNRLLRILGHLLFSDTQNHPFSILQQAGVTKNLIVEIYYNVTYDSDTKKHQTTFLELIGYLNLHAFLEKEDIKLDPSIPLELYQHPTSKYLDNTYGEERTKVLQPHADVADDMTAEEKEQEAEKLFVLFERMEKLGTFEKFQNPVKQWQQEGKFEHIE